jgi:hypothetical protein
LIHFYKRSLTAMMSESEEAGVDVPVNAKAKAGDTNEAEEASKLDTTDEIGNSHDLNDSHHEEPAPSDEHNTSTDAVLSDSGTVEEELDVGDESPELKNSSLRIQQDNGHGENGQDEEATEKPVNNIQADISKMSISDPGLSQRKPVEIRPVHIGDMNISRGQLKFEVVTAKVMEEGGKKFVAYTIMLKRASGDPHPALIHRRYNDFCKLYERILCTFHKSVLGDFQFPQKVIIRNFKAEVISERTDAFHRFLNLIANNDKLLYSDYFHAFMCTEEQNEAVSYIKLGRYHEAGPLLETIFYIREKMFTLSHISVLECVIELVACLAAVKSDETAYRYALIASQCIQLSAGHPYLAQITVPFLKLAESLAESVGHDPKPYKKQISELRYSGVKTDRVPTLLEVIRDKYIHTATKTARAY